MQSKALSASYYDRTSPTSYGHYHERRQQRSADETTSDRRNKNVSPDIGEDGSAHGRGVPQTINGLDQLREHKLLVARAVGKRNEEAEQRDGEAYTGNGDRLRPPGGVNHAQIKRDAAYLTGADEKKGGPEGGTFGALRLSALLHRLSRHGLYD